MLCSILAFSIGITTAADAETSPNFAIGISGKVYIGGQPAPVNTIIDARVNDKSVGTGLVQNAGLIGDTNNNRLTIITDDGNNVDIYVNNVKAGSIIYRSQDAGKIIPLDLNAPATGTSGGTTGSPGGSGNGVGSDSVSRATPKVTTQQAGAQIKSLQETPATGTTPSTVTTTAAVPKEFNSSLLLGVYGILVLCVIVIFALMKRGKI